jgi:hypothetical protein
MWKKSSTGVPPYSDSEVSPPSVLSNLKSGAVEPTNESWGDGCEVQAVKINTKIKNKEMGKVYFFMFHLYKYMDKVDRNHTMISERSSLLFEFR